MKKLFKKFISDHNPFLLFFHKLKAVFAAVLYGFPADKMKVIGVTGTNGKTTTVNMITHLLYSSGYKVGMLSSITFQINGEQWINKTKMSTQSPFFIQKMLRKMLKAGCEYAVIEVTSHSVVQSRVWGVNFDVGVWTNLSEDHLDYHGSWENYAAAKFKFIAGVQGQKKKVGVPKVVVLNADDAEFARFDSVHADKKYTFGLQKGDTRAAEVQLRPDGSTFLVSAPNAMIKIQMSLIGDFNVLNALAAVNVALSQGLSQKDIEAGFKTMKPVPGRYEVIDCGQPFSVIVDYAHTEDALGKLCEIFRELTGGKLIVVFGSTGGGRDKGKRPKLGAIVAQYADYIILTNDDPYEENQLQIIRDIRAGIPDIQIRNFEVIEIVDRGTAIEAGLGIASARDTVLIAGKGCEPVIAIDGKLIPWDDREVARNVLSRPQIVEL